MGLSKRGGDVASLSGHSPSNRKSGRKSGTPISVDPLDPAGWTQDPTAIAEKVVFRLWADGAVSGRAIEQARRDRDNRLRLDQTLRQMGVIDDEGVSFALFEELNISVVEAIEFPAQAIAVDELPAKFIEETLTTPLSDDGVTLRLAMADPLDDYVLRAIAIKTRRKLEIYGAAPSVLRAEIARLYGGQKERVHKASSAISPLDPPLGPATGRGNIRRFERSARASFIGGGWADNARRSATKDGKTSKILEQAPEDQSERTQTTEGGANACSSMHTLESARKLEALSKQSRSASDFLKPRFVRPRHVNLKNRADGDGKSRVVPPREEERDQRRRMRQERAASKRSPEANALIRREPRLIQEPEARSGSHTPMPTARPARELAEKPAQFSAKKRFVGGFVNGFIGADPMAPLDTMPEPETRFGVGSSRTKSEPEDRLNAISERLRARGAADAEPALDESKPAGPLTEAEKVRRDTPVRRDAMIITRRDLRLAQRRSRHQKAREFVLAEIRRSLQGAQAAVRDVKQAEDAVVLHQEKLHPEQSPAASSSPVRNPLHGEKGTLVGPSHQHDSEKNSITQHAIAEGPAVLGRAATSARRPSHKEATPSAAGVIERRASLILDDVARIGNGLVIVCGSAGAGRMETLRRIATRISERPNAIERLDNDDLLAAITRVGGAIGDNPDILKRIAIGEIRDAQSADTAARLALTGGVALASLNVPTVSAAPPRLVQLGLPPQALAASLRAIIAQALVERPCARCMGTGRHVSGEACPECGGEGIDSVPTMVEAIAPDEPLRTLILAGANEDSFHHLFANGGYHDFSNINTEQEVVDSSSR